MEDSPKRSIPDRSLTAFVKGVAQLLRHEVKALSLKEKKTEILKNKEGPAHKIECLASLLRRKAHELNKKKSK